LVGLVAYTAQQRMDQGGGHGPAWVQAVGSIIAIGAGFLTMFLQNRHADKVQKAERSRRAEVVAYRLSGWITEIGARIQVTLRTCQERQSKASQGPPRLASDLIPELRLGSVSEIDGLLPELHYLSAGSGDIAQLDYFAKFFDEWLAREYTAATKPGVSVPMWAGPTRREFYSYAERQLKMMSTLHANAERRISPLVQTAIDGGR
jgi:hypothetical protein